MRKTKSSLEVPSEAVTRVAEWCTPTPGLSLSADAVHVWRADLDLEAGRLRSLEQNLSVDERARAARFRFAQDRKRFIAARGLLRQIVAYYLNMAARELRFGYGAHGKPFLAEPKYSGLHFNVSHSLDLALIAVAYEREVGVDIEHVRTDIAVKEIAEIVLSGPEKHALSRFVGEAKRMAFLQLWTRKEAYIKADGRGVSLPLKHIDVSVPANRVSVLDEATGKSKVCGRWMLQTLAVGPDYAAALAAEGQDWQLTCWQWQDRQAHNPIY
jgi:4'-phosphopantetheinyl transferase